MSHVSRRMPDNKCAEKKTKTCCSIIRIWIGFVHCRRWWRRLCGRTNNKIVIGMAIGCLPRVTTQSIRKMHLLRVRKILITCAITRFVHISRQLVVHREKSLNLCATNTPFENRITWHLLLLLLPLHQRRNLITILANKCLVEFITKFWQTSKDLNNSNILLRTNKVLTPPCLTKACCYRHQVSSENMKIYQVSCYVGGATTHAHWTHSPKSILDLIPGNVMFIYLFTVRWAVNSNCHSTDMLSSTHSCIFNFFLLLCSHTFFCYDMQ